MPSELDRRFHWISYRGHRAPQLASIVERLWDTTQGYRRAYVRLTRQEGARLTNAEHRLLLAALERRETGTASAVLVTHIRRTCAALRDTLREHAR